MNNGKVWEFLDSLDSADSTDEARQLAESFRQQDDVIDELIELARAHKNGRTTHRSIAEQVGIEGETAWRALEVLPDVFDWETESRSSSGR